MHEGVRCEMLIWFPHNRVFHKTAREEDRETSLSFFFSWYANITFTRRYKSQKEQHQSLQQYNRARDF
jgi:hypothetical protein